MVGSETPHCYTRIPRRTSCQSRPKLSVRAREINPTKKGPQSLAAVLLACPLPPHLGSDSGPLHDQPTWATSLVTMTVRSVYRIARHLRALPATSPRTPRLPRKAPSDRQVSAMSQPLQPRIRDLRYRLSHPSSCTASLRNSSRACLLSTVICWT